MTVEHLRGLSARDLVLGFFYSLPSGCELHKDLITNYLIEKIDISAKEVNDNLRILCGDYYNPLILRLESGNYTICNEGRKQVETFVKNNFSEEQLISLEKLTKDFLRYGSLKFI